jgi:myo-inositol-1-phosphate synthase
VLTNLFRERGVRLDRTYQLNFGGNTDFLNMLERERLESKKISKTQAVTSQLGHPMPASNVHVGPSDYVPWMTDRKWCYIRMEGTTFGDVPINCEMKLEVWDSPNSAGVVIDAVRCAKLALDRGLSGALVGPSSYFMKTPPRQFTDEQARALTEAFIHDEDSMPGAINGQSIRSARLQRHGDSERFRKSRTLVETQNGSPFSKAKQSVSKVRSGRMPQPARQRRALPRTVARQKS